MKEPASELVPPSWVDVVGRKVASIRFGAVVITVHDGRVTQVESTEKTRLVPDQSEGARSTRAGRRT